MLDVFKMKKLGSFVQKIPLGRQHPLYRKMQKIFWRKQNRSMKKDSIHCTGKCRRYSGGSKTDQ